MKKLTYYVWGLALLALLISCIAYPNATTDIPIHWNTQGEIDGYAPTWAMFILPLTIPLFDLFLTVCRRLDPKTNNYVRFDSTFQILRVIMASFMFLLYIYMIIEVFIPDRINMTTLILCATGILISTFGNFMPKVKPNYFIGFRTPWALMNETVWIHTHRIGGRAWFVGGFLFFVMALAPEAIADFIPYLITLVLIIYPALYSYLYYRKLMQKGEQHD